MIVSSIVSRKAYHHAVEPTHFERSLRAPQNRIVRHERARALGRIFEFARFSIDDVVNDRGAAAAVRALWRVARACEWESLRSALEARIAREAFSRANR
jgi:hypothetical protein